MYKYKINWFKYIGLYIISIALQLHYGFRIGFFIGFLIYPTYMLVSTERRVDDPDEIF